VGELYYVDMLLYGYYLRSVWVEAVIINKDGE
jgi:hypothetical protein